MLSLHLILLPESMDPSNLYLLPEQRKDEDFDDDLEETLLDEVGFSCVFWLINSH